MQFGAAPAEEPSALEGKAVFVRTVTHHYTGRVESITDRWLVLTECAWIADDGRFSVALATGELSEVEPFPDGAVWIGVGAVLDLSEWQHALPRSVK
jgi:hypothetical protein